MAGNKIVVDVSSIMQDLVKKNRAYWEAQMSDTNIYANLFSRRGEMAHGSYEVFEYVVQRKEQSRICFLTGQDRYRKPKEKITPAYMDPEQNGIIQKISNKIRSKRGVGGLADIQRRFKDYYSSVPDVNRYDPYPKKRIKVSQFPFGTSLKVSRKILNKNPGPGYYEMPKQCRRPKKEYCGGGLKIVPCVELKCTPTSVDKCSLCQKICAGDYWYGDNKAFLCLRCMRDERKMKTKFKLSELNRFKKIRNCCFTHQHEGTTASIYLLTKSQLQSKFRIENYLTSYFNKYI